MNSKDIRNLRAQLATRLSKVLRNPVIEQKELAAFDLIMGRREFLRKTHLATVAALVAVGLPPTAWGRRNSTLTVCPKDVGLTVQEQASVGVATQLIAGTELFQDTIYAQPVVAPEEVFSHGLVEGARPLLRFQSELGAAEPIESNFLDDGWHYGPSELIQLEQTDGSWELVHYHHPWGARKDGGRTDSLVRRVILDASDGLTNPTKLLTSTAADTNEFTKSGQNAIAGFLYMVFVEQDGGAGENLIGMGVGAITTAEPWSEAPIYPMRWEFKPLGKIGIAEKAANYRSCDKITHSAYSAKAGAYDPSNANEQIVLYYTDKIYILGISAVVAGYGYLMNSVLSVPADAPDARVIHSDYSSGSQIKFVVLASTEKQSNGDHLYTLYSLGGELNDASQPDGRAQNPQRFGINLEWGKGVFERPWRTSSFTVPASEVSEKFPALDYTTTQTVQSLYTLTPGANYHIKLANFVGYGIVAFALTDDGSETPTFELAGHFPMRMPDAAGLGAILNFSGGLSKFGGYRLVALDENGSIFLMRQRRAEAEDSPYVSPIYGNFTADGLPITSFSTSDDPIPATTDANSNLFDLANWIGISTGSGVNSVDAYNFMLSVALAFATDDTSQAQGTWLGNGFKAAYAPLRSGQDSNHVVVKQVQSGSTNVFGVFNALKNPVDKTWRLRQLATQQLVSGPGESESGDHYQVTFTPANAYGKPVSLLSSVNANLQIEVRADSSVTVTDDTHNLYYDIDRYTSFVAQPDPSTSRLSVVVKAETYSQVLYGRLLDTSTLTPSSDTAMLTGTDPTVFPWMQTNLAAQAQARMANQAEGAEIGAYLGIADTVSYVSETSLKQSNTDTPWQTKASFSGSDSNFQGIANYLNTSARNLATATQQNSFAVLLGDSTVDPLTAVTPLIADSTNPTTTTSFVYAYGTVTSASSAPGVNFPIGSPEPGSFWKSISHALHDALHWLQHVDDKVYSELAQGVQLVTSDVESVAVTVSADIMKQVNGVEQELNEVVNTVEEYASVIVNVVITIVEQSFLYKFIELLIALISLFIYFKDVLALNKSFQSFFNGLFSGQGSVSLPSVTIDSASISAPSLGPNNQIASGFGSVDTSNVATEVETALIDAISSNPLSKKILNKLMSAIVNALSAAVPNLPFSFSLDDSVAQDAISDIDNLEASLVQAIEGMAVTAAQELVQDVASDLANPQATFQDLANQLGTLVEDIGTELLDDLFSLVDQIAQDGPALAHDVIEQSDYVTIDLTVIADLCKLAGIGDAGSGKFTLSAGDAIFFPIAVIAWVTIYMHEGKSISSVNDLEEDLLVETGDFGAVDTTRWNLIRIAVDTLLQEVLGLIWLVKESEDEDNGGLSSAEQTFVACGAWIGLARWANDLGYSSYLFANSPRTVKTNFDFGIVAFRTFTAAANTVLTLPGKNLNPGDGWSTSDPKRTDITQLMNFIADVSVIGVDTIEGVQNDPNEAQILALVGSDIFRTQLIFLFVYNLFSLDDLIEEFGFAVMGAPIAGAFLEELGLNLSSPIAEEDTQDCIPRRRARRRRRRQQHRTRWQHWRSEKQKQREKVRFW